MRNAADSLIPLLGVGLTLLAIWLVYKARQVATSVPKWLFGAGAGRRSDRARFSSSS